jgi:hypothetical protein
MRIYNARKSQISIPLTATEKIVVPSYGTSESFLPNPRILSLIVTSFDYSDIALIVSGPNEMTMCSETPCCSGFVANSLEEALERFQTETTASMKCAAKVIDPINEERLEEAKKAEKAESEPTPEVKEETPEAPSEEKAGEPETISVDDIAGADEELVLDQAPQDEVPTEDAEATKKGKGKKNNKK